MTRLLANIIISECVNKDFKFNQLASLTGQQKNNQRLEAQQ